MRCCCLLLSPPSRMSFRRRRSHFDRAHVLRTLHSHRHHLLRRMPHRSRRHPCRGRHHFHRAQVPGIHLRHDFGSAALLPNPMGTFFVASLLSSSPKSKPTSSSPLRTRSSLNSASSKISPKNSRAIEATSAPHRLKYPALLPTSGPVCMAICTSPNTSRAAARSSSSRSPSTPSWPLTITQLAPSTAPPEGGADVRYSRGGCAMG